MKRLLFSLVGLVVLAAVVVAGWMLFREAGTSEPTAEAPAPGAIAAISETRAETVAEDAALDLVENVVPVAVEAPVRAAYYGMGGGGGGGGYGEMYRGPFADAAFALSAPLPTAESVSLYEMIAMGSQPVDVEALKAFAARLGINGTVYYDWYAGMPTDGSTSADGIGPNSYRVIDGQKRVSAYSSGEFIYEDMALANYYSTRPLPFAENAAIAERFAQDHGLLDFPYVLHQGWGYEVQFLELVDGHPVNFPKLSINITGDGQVAFLVLRTQVAGAALESVALRSAQAAWDYLLAHAEDGQILYNLMATNPAYYVPAASSSQKTNWQREFGSTEALSMVTWVSILRPVGGTGSLIVLTDRNYRVIADDRTLDDIAQASLTSNNLRLTGIVSGQPGNGTIELTSWGPISGPSDLYLGGITRQEGGQIYLEVPGGYRFALDSAPADLPLDVAVNVYSWGIHPDTAGLPVLDWTSIDLWNVPYVEDTDYAAADPYNGVTDVTISQVTLGYQAMYPGEMLPGMTSLYVQGEAPRLIPIWIFAGQTNKGDVVEFFVPAPSDIDLQ